RWGMRQLRRCSANRLCVFPRQVLRVPSRPADIERAVSQGSAAPETKIVGTTPVTPSMAARRARARRHVKAADATLPSAIVASWVLLLLSEAERSHLAALIALKGVRMWWRIAVAAALLALLASPLAAEVDCVKPFISFVQKISDKPISGSELAAVHRHALRIF